MKQKYLILTGLLLSLITKSYSQSTENQYSGWLAIYHKQKLTGKWGYLFDAQYRTDKQFSNTSAYLLRPGISYDVSKNQAAGAGYAFFGSYEDEKSSRIFYAENRIWEQYQIDAKIGKATLSNRLRLEQRFINMENGGFSQRLRYYIRSQVPLVKVEDSFKKGIYMALQNELFVNVQHQERASNSFLDQNRSYISFGYRLNKKIDTELGYQYVYSKDPNGNLRNNVFQVAIYTDF
ncbi:DUF2490 domain-containing protein [Mucilaginibacter arboris]|uniref:DUF2490 domain-containing protein n=1 Tax=Mucilaginibacter arboris TaxID=2682090 RepID=A0A7K1SXN6_9SPHI|nr:DUF2490 domain-containing protein [Mucilaginibacter arboris]MVN21780.1 DUF2490 domain-containing protein [Mucilaginibacter arboris]